MKITLPSDWSGMFLLEAGDNPAHPEGARPVALPSLSLHVFDPLRVLAVQDPDGRQIGALLGTPIDPRQAHVPQGTISLPEAPGEDIDGFVERCIYPLTGSWIFVLDLPGARRLYLDACGSLSAVYEPGKPRAAAISSQLVDPGEVESRFDRELYEALRVDRDGWFPAGLTGHHGIRRLMPNHYYDLDAGRAVRHWPTGPIPRGADPDAACATILATTRATLGTLATAGPVSVALTAGNETRMILAASRDLPGDICFTTVTAEGAELDRTRAQELAARFDLPHRLIPIRVADPAGEQDWQARAAFSIGGPHVRTHPTSRQLRDRPYFVGGLGGEIGRGFLWRKTDAEETRLDADAIWARMGMAPHPRGVAAVAEWLEALQRDLGPLPSLLVLDLAYLEIRMGCWGFAGSYTNTAPVDIHPLIGRDNFAAMLSLPPEWRRMKKRTNRMITGVIEQGWPELLQLPISRHGDMRDYIGLAQRIRKQPHLLAKKLRKAIS